MRRIGALRYAARLAVALGKTERAEQFGRRAESAARAVRKRLWSQERGLFLDEPDGALLAEHTSIMAILYDVVNAEEARQVIRRIEEHRELARTSIAYTYYTFRAYEKLGLYKRAYGTRLHNWTDQLKLHASTWFETPEPSRSDCHGWGSWIMTDLLTSVLGITPAEPGFASVRIAPQLFDIEWARGTMPTVRGEIAVSYRRKKGKAHCEIQLPADISGEFVAPQGERRPLQSGRQEVEFEIGDGIA